MDYVKDAFQKVKGDMDSLTEEISALRSGLIETRERMIEICGVLNDLTKKYADLSNLSNPTDKEVNSTNSTGNPTVRQEIKGLKPDISIISTGNEGVPTDKQTNRQTNKIPGKFSEKEENTIENALNILESLDTIKKEIRLKFKRLTEQELLVFSTIYQIEEELGPPDYRTVSKKLNLSESSIRDYVQRILRKGISIEKKRINNKVIQLSISENLKKVASLQTILKLRDI